MAKKKQNDEIIEESDEMADELVKSINGTLILKSTTIERLLNNTKPIKMIDDIYCLKN